MIKKDYSKKNKFLYSGYTFIQMMEWMEYRKKLRSNGNRPVKK